MKIALLYSFEKSSWKSCQFISANLIKTYQLISDADISHFNFYPSINENDEHHLAQNIFAYRPDFIAIVDHRPHPKNLLMRLSHLYANDKSIKMPQILIHIFGDFTLNADNWIFAEKYLENFKIKFICASKRQKQLISSFLNTRSNELYQLPFPVDSEQFYFSNTIRDIKRKQLNLPPSTVVFLYTGRLSLQKNILNLVLDFSIFLKTSKSDSLLYLAGDFDDIGNQFTGAVLGKGEFYQRFLNITSRFPPDVQSRIKYLGNLNQVELLGIYSAADCFISLSAHNDEDYGMSPAEAICTGLPAILSDWGGYASFNLEGKNECDLIPMKMGNAIIEYDKSQLIKALLIKTIKVSGLREKREMLTQLNSNTFSIKSNASKLLDILEDETPIFKGFSNYIHLLAAAFKKPIPFVHPKLQYSDLYKELYSNYIQNK